MGPRYITRLEQEHPCDAISFYLLLGSQHVAPSASLRRVIHAWCRSLHRSLHSRRSSSVLWQLAEMRPPRKQSDVL